jgi:hypothetical protein
MQGDTGGKSRMFFQKRLNTIFRTKQENMKAGQALEGQNDALEDDSRGFVPPHGINCNLERQRNTLSWLGSKKKWIASLWPDLEIQRRT